MTDSAHNHTDDPATGPLGPGQPAREETPPQDPAAAGSAAEEQSAQNEPAQNAPAQESSASEPSPEAQPPQESPAAESPSETAPPESTPAPGGETSVSAGASAEEPEVEEPEEEEYVGTGKPIEEIVEEPAAEANLDWYILKVASNREDSIREGLMRRVKVAGLEEFFDEVIVPTETVTEYKGGRRRTRKQKLYPGYLLVHMEINDDTWFLVRETPGIGDFTGAGGKPTPMPKEEVERILAITRPPKDREEPKARVDIQYKIGERVKIKAGHTFENFEGDVDAIDEANGRVTVMINIFGRSTPVELEYWQVESV